jgi:hypothetical protein
MKGKCAVSAKARSKTALCRIAHVVDAPDAEDGSLDWEHLHEHVAKKINELNEALRECRKEALFSIDVIAALHPEASVPMTAAYHAVDENTAWADEEDPIKAHAARAAEQAAAVCGVSARSVESAANVIEKRRAVTRPLLTLYGPPAPTAEAELRRANREGFWAGLLFGVALGALAAWHALDLARWSP